MTVLAIILGVVVVIYPIFLLCAVKFGMKMVERPEERNGDNIGKRYRRIVFQNPNR